MKQEWELAKERVLAAWPGTLFMVSMQSAIVARPDGKIIGWPQKNVGMNFNSEADAWLDAASRLPAQAVAEPTVDWTDDEAVVRAADSGALIVPDGSFWAIVKLSNGCCYRANGSMAWTKARYDVGVIEWERTHNPAYVTPAEAKDANAESKPTRPNCDCVCNELSDYMDALEAENAALRAAQSAKESEGEGMTFEQWLSLSNIQGHFQDVTSYRSGKNRRDGTEILLAMAWDASRASHDEGSKK